MFVFFPLGRDDVQKKYPIVTIILIFINTILFFWTVAMEFSFRASPYYRQSMNFTSYLISEAGMMPQKWRPAIGDIPREGDYPVEKAVPVIEMAGKDMLTDETLFQLTAPEVNFAALKTQLRKNVRNRPPLDALLLKTAGVEESTSVKSSKQKFLDLFYEKQPSDPLEKVTDEALLASLNKILAAPGLYEQLAGRMSYDPYYESVNAFNDTLKLEIPKASREILLNRKILAASYEGVFNTAKDKLVFLYQDYLKAKEESRRVSAPDFSFYRTFAYFPGGKPFPNLFTYQFLHGDIWHLLGNMLFLWIVGCNIEQRWGAPLFLLLYLSGGAVSGYMFGLKQQAGMLIGASGAISAVMGAFLIKNYRMGIRFFYLIWLFIFVKWGKVRIPAWIVLPGWFLQQIIMQYTAAPGDNVAYSGHISGYIYGTLMGFLVYNAGLNRPWEASAEKTKTALDLKINEASFFFDGNEFEKARQLCEEVLLADPDNIEAKAGLACVYEKLKQPGKGANALAGLINTAMQKGRSDIADKTYMRWSDSLKPEYLSPEDKFALAQSLDRAGNYNGALKYYKSAEGAALGDQAAGKILFRVGKLLKDKADRKGEAAAYFEKLLAPPYELTWRELAQAELNELKTAKVEKKEPPQDKPPEKPNPYWQ
jgi:membrane associated rhomboid family serine protease